MRAHLRRRMESGSSAWQPGRTSASSPTTCSARGLGGRDGVERDVLRPQPVRARARSRGRGIGLALLAASLPYTRELGFTRQATIVLERNRPMIAAATQMLGFAVTGHAERRELLGRVRWSWRLHGSCARARGSSSERFRVAGGTALVCR